MPSEQMSDKRVFKPTQDGVGAASAWLDETLESSAYATSAQLATLPVLHIILDEICSNIVKHSGAKSFSVAADLPSAKSVRLQFADDGAEYNPLRHLDPDTTLPADMRPIGGLGIMLVKRMASDVSYDRIDGRNILRVTVESKI